MSKHDDIPQGPHGLVNVSIMVDAEFIGPYTRGGVWDNAQLGNLRIIGLENLQGQIVCTAFLLPEGDEKEAVDFLTMICEARGHV